MNAKTEKFFQKGREIVILKGYKGRIFESPVSNRYAYITGRDGQGKRTQQIVLGKEHDYAQSVKAAVRVAHAVACSDKPIFVLERWRSIFTVLRPCKYGEQLMRALQLPFEDIQATLPKHYFNPLFDLLRSCRDVYLPDGVLISHWKSLLNDEAHALYQSLEDLVRDLRERMRKPEIVRILDSARRGSDKRWKSVKKAIIESTQDCSKLVAVRIDLSFHMATTLYPFAPDVSEDQAYGYVVKFERHLRDKYPLVRYMWSQEYGTQTGFHFHMLVLLNGHIVRNDILIAKRMGEHWENVITEGKGRYFNCNANAYCRPGLGVIQCANPIEVDGLINDVAKYLTKSDFWMRCKARGKAFGTSQRHRKHSRRGAKRKPREEGDASAVIEDL